MTSRGDRLPDFLIIGAMKAGTTTLYRDLYTHPRLFLPEDKEPESLCSEAVLSVAGRRAYARLFKPARADQKCGEASTAYTKLPDHPGVATRARTLLGESLRIIYIVREPVSRLLSHYRHALGFGQIEPGIERALECCPGLLAYSRYAMQLEPWVDAFGLERIRVVRFEDYVTNRSTVAAEVAAFIGVDGAGVKVLEGRTFNRSEGKPVPDGLWSSAVRDNPIYRRYVRPLLPWQLREKLRHALVKSSSPNGSDDIDDSLLAHLTELLRPESERLQEMLGLPEPLWPSTAAAPRTAAGSTG